MGQEQSYAGHSNAASVKRYSDKYDDPIQYRESSVEFRFPKYEDKDYRRNRIRRSADSFKSDNSSTGSSGYRSGSSTYDCHSNRSFRSDYHCAPLYKNDHYKDLNKELYKPVKINKDKRYKVIYFDDNPEIKSARLKGYLSETEKTKLKSGQTPIKTGIRNYTPKIISTEEQNKE